MLSQVSSADLSNTDVTVEICGYLKGQGVRLDELTFNNNYATAEGINSLISMGLARNVSVNPYNLQQVLENVGDMPNDLIDIVVGDYLSDLRVFQQPANHSHEKQPEMLGDNEGNDAGMDL